MVNVEKANGIYIGELEYENSNLKNEIKKLRKTTVMQELEYNQLLKSYNRLAQEFEDLKESKTAFSIFKK